MRRAAKIYGWLLKLYPARFREEYGGPMEREFLDSLREVGGRWGRAMVWVKGVADVAMTAPGEVAREIGADARHGLRQYRRRAVSTALAVAALGLAMGASTGVFSVMSALLLRGLPFSGPERLVALRPAPVGALSGRAAFLDWQRRSAYVEGAAEFSRSEMNLAEGRGALRVKAAETSANFFAVLGMRPERGRWFRAGEDVTGRNGVAVISDGLWRQAYGADPEVTERDLYLNGARFRIVGVAAAGADYPAGTSVWTPTVFDGETIPKRGAFLMETVARLKAGLDEKAAREMYEAEMRRGRRAGEREAWSEMAERPRMVPLRDELAGPVREASWVLEGMTLLLLLTACASVAQLLLSRTAERRQEMAVRAALGASRARLVQQLTTEAAMLTGAGAALGLVVARWTCGLASMVAPAPLGAQEYTVLDGRVLGYAAGLALGTGIAFGVLPAWMIGRLLPVAGMVRAQPGGREAVPRRARAGLAATQAALAVCLVTAFVGLAATMVKLLHVDLGFRARHVVTLSVSLEGTRYAGGREWGYYKEALERLRAVPGVEAAGAVSYPPLAKELFMAGMFRLDSGQTVGPAVLNAATAGYFRAMGMGIVAGRDFDRGEMRRAERAVVVNETFARAAGMGSGIVGRRLRAPWGGGMYTIAGVVKTARQSGPEEAGIAEVYWPVEEEAPPRLTMVAKVAGPGEEWLARCRDAVKAGGAEAAVYGVMTLNERVAETLARPRFYTGTALFLGALAVLLAGAGIYGTAVYAVAQRRREIGLRMAVGGTAGRIRAMMLRESVAPVVLGAAGGIVLWMGAGRMLEHVVVNAARPWWGVWAAAMFLAAAGVGAGWAATRGIGETDAAEALRAE